MRKREDRDELSPSFDLYQPPSNPQRTPDCTQKIVLVQKRLSAYSNIRVIANPGDAELDELIGNAHINLLFTYQSTGIKLKLLHALFAGRHCLVNPVMVHGTGLSSLCSVAESADSLEAHLHELMKRSFSSEEVQERKKALKEFSNRANAEKIIRILG